MAFISVFLSLIILPVHAGSLSFNDLLNSDYLQLDHEADASVRLNQAKAFSHFRKYPNGVETLDLKSACLRDPQSNVFCPLLQPLPEAKALVTPKILREKYFAALLKLNDVKNRAENCKAVRPQLQSVVDDGGAVRLEARALFWLWTCAGLAKDSNARSVIKERLWRRFPLDHHTFMVLESEHDPRIYERLKDDSDLAVLPRSSAHPELNPWLQGIEALLKMKEAGTAAYVTFVLDSQLRMLEPEVKLYLIAVMSRAARTIPSTLPVSRLAVPLIASHPDLLTRTLAKVLFPDDYPLFDSIQGQTEPARDLILPFKARVNPSLLEGLIYYESAFNPHAGSSANAFGLVQLLIGTATDEYRKESHDPSAVVSREQLLDPQFNLKLGVGVLEDLKGSMKSWPLAFAAYNAGEGAIGHWLKKNSKITDPQIQIDLLLMNSKIEIHVSDYVSSVFGKANWYSALYSKD